MHALQTDDRHAAIDAVIADLGLTVSAQFVPFSQSRNRHEKSPSLNWWITLRKYASDSLNSTDGKRYLTILETDYSAGCGHCPAYKASIKDLGSQNSIMRDNAIRKECETGKEGSYGNHIYSSKPRLILPDIRDVIYSFVQDAGVLDARGFEDWAADYGYDTDSRKAEAIYRACLEIALQLRNGIGEAGLARLQDAFQDY